MKARFTLAAVVATMVSFGAVASMSQAAVSVEAFDNSTIKPAGPRIGTNNINFFNVEGNNNGTNASYGAADFSGAAFGFTGSTPTINSIQLVLTESNAAFTLPGTINFWLSTDTTTVIGNAGSPTTPFFDASSLPGGIGSQFGTLSPLGSGSFTTTGNVNTGQADTYTLTLSPADSAYIAQQLSTGGTIRILITPGDNAVAATFAGYNHNTYAGPTLVIDAVVPEPASLSLLALPAVALLRRRVAR